MYRRPRAELDHLAPIFTLLGTGVIANGMQVVPETLSVFFPDSPNALDDWIGLHDYTSNSSCGVQIVGGSCPKERMTASIFGRNAGFAI
jgi:hypothetical protein